MDYNEALKQAKEANKKREHYWIVTFGWSDKYIVPHKEGLMFMEALAQAELFDEGYSDKPPSITSIPKDKITINPLSYEDLIKYRVAMLLDVSFKSLKEKSKEAETL